MKGWANLCTQIIHKCMGGRETDDELGENATSGIVKKQGVNVNEQEEKMEMVRKKMVFSLQEWLFSIGSKS